MLIIIICTFINIKLKDIAAMPWGNLTQSLLFRQKLPNRASERNNRTTGYNTADKAHIFNVDNLKTFRQEINSTASLICHSVGRAANPFTGILPAELAERFSHLDLDSPRQSLEDTLSELESLYLNDAVYFHHPRYMMHLNPPVSRPAIAAELIQAAINTSVDTWDQSAGGTFIEQSLIDWTLKKIGFPQGSDGIFTSGGTQSNLMALLLARDNYCLKHLNGHSIQLHGLPPEAGRFRIFTSCVSHFSIQKAAALLGLGFESVVSIPVDKGFRMDPGALRRSLAQCRANGEIPIAVVATMGTTDFGSIDPIAAIKEVCDAYGMWLHADAAYGCGLLTSPKNRWLIEDIHHADSVTVDYHKSFLQPVACGAFFAKISTDLACLTYHAEYLNPLSQKLEGTPNLVCKSLQTTRRFDALKLWVTLRTIGPDTIGEVFDNLIDLAHNAWQAHHQDPELEFIHEPVLSTLVFRFVPARLADHNGLNELNLEIRKWLSRHGKALIASTRIQGTLYLKLTLLNPAVTLTDVSDVIAMIKMAGRHLMETRYRPEPVTGSETCATETV